MSSGHQIAYCIPNSESVKMYGVPIYYVTDNIYENNRCPKVNKHQNTTGNTQNAPLNIYHQDTVDQLKQSGSVWNTYHQRAVNPPIYPQAVNPPYYPEAVNLPDYQEAVNPPNCQHAMNPHKEKSDPCNRPHELTASNDAHHRQALQQTKTNGKESIFRPDTTKNNCRASTLSMPREAQDPFPSTKNTCQASTLNTPREAQDPFPSTNNTKPDISLTSQQEHNVSSSYCSNNTMISESEEPQIWHASCNAYSQKPLQKTVTQVQNDLSKTKTKCEETKGTIRSRQQMKLHTNISDGPQTQSSDDCAKYSGRKCTSSNNQMEVYTLNEVGNIQIGENNVMNIQCHTPMSWSTHKCGTYTTKMKTVYSRQKPAVITGPRLKKVFITSSKKQLDDANMEMLSKHLGYHWKELARHLGYSDGEIDAIDHDNIMLQEKIWQLLRFWRESRAEKATFCAVADALIAMKKYDIAVQLKVH